MPYRAHNNCEPFATDFKTISNKLKNKYVLYYTLIIIIYNNRNYATSSEIDSRSDGCHQLRVFREIFPIRVIGKFCAKFFRIFCQVIDVLTKHRKEEAVTVLSTLGKLSLLASFRIQLRKISAPSTDSFRKFEFRDENGVTETAPIILRSL